MIKDAIGRRRTDKGLDQCSDLIRSRAQCEMTGVENINFRVPLSRFLQRDLPKVQGQLCLKP